jgi:WD40 repeat protein
MRRDGRTILLLAAGLTAVAVALLFQPGAPDKPPGDELRPEGPDDQFVGEANPANNKEKLVLPPKGLPVAGPSVRLGTQRFRHSGLIRGLALAPDGKVLASCGWDRLVRLWDPATGVELRRLSANDEEINCVDFSRDGHWLAAGTQAGIVYLWEAATGKERARWRCQANGIQDLAFSPDSQSLAASGLEAAIRFWQVPTGAKLASYTASQNTFWSFAISPDGQTLAGCGANGLVTLWDLATGMIRQELSGPSIGGLCVAFVPNQASLAVSYRDGTIHFWNLATGAEQDSLKDPAGRVDRITISPDGQYLASTGPEARLWRLGGGKQPVHIQPTHGFIRPAAFSLDGTTLFIASSEDHIIHRWDTCTGKEMQTEGDGQGAVTAVALAADGATVIVAGSDGTVRAWSQPGGKLMHRYNGHRFAVNCVASSADGSLLASGGMYDGKVRVWEAKTSRELRQLDTGTQSVRRVTFPPGGQSLVAEDEEGFVHVWDQVTGKELNKSGGERPAAAEFSPDGSLLAVWKRSVEIWDLSNSEIVGELTPHFQSPQGWNGTPRWGVIVSALALSPGGAYLAYTVQHEGSSIHICEAATSREVNLLKGHARKVRVLAYSHTGNRLASGGGEGEVWLWNTVTGKPVRRFVGHEGPVTSLAFSSDDQTLVSGSDDTTALVWDLREVPD